MQMNDIFAAPASVSVDPSYTTGGRLTILAKEGTRMFIKENIHSIRHNFEGERIKMRLRKTKNQHSTSNIDQNVFQYLSLR